MYVREFGLLIVWIARRGFLMVDMYAQGNEPGGVQIHLLDGVRAPHVGPRAGCRVCSAGRLLCRARLGQWPASAAAGPALCYGRDTGLCGLVDGPQWPAGP